MKICPRGCKIGYEEYHTNLHFLFDNNIIPLEVDAKFRNQQILEYLDHFGTLNNKIINRRLNTAEDYQALPVIQRIDRELRNILEPSKHSKKAREDELKVRQHYSNSDNKDHITEDLVSV